MAPAPAPKPKPRRTARNKAAAAAAAAADAAHIITAEEFARDNGLTTDGCSAAPIDNTSSRQTNESVVKCPNPDCDEPDIQEIEGNLTCASCGAVLDDTNFVNDVDFAETAAGAAVVQGSYVAGDKRYATTLDGRSRHAGGGMTSHELTLNRGRDALRHIAATVGLNESISDRAHTIYKLAANNNMIQGRGVREVAACCLYMSCRQENFDGASSLVLLIDFADAIRVNVYRLGKIYSDIKEGTFMTDDPIFKPTRPLVPVIDIEQIILRYCRKLDFGDDTQKVATDAARILRRMKRDWIVTGRTPSGLVGAALILGARMNNHRRTSREVTYLVKAAEVTVNKRISEFMNTTAGNLTLDDFREYSDRIKDSAVPPAIYNREERDRKKRARDASADDGSEERPQVIGDTPEPPSRATSEQPTGARLDSDGFAIPAPPARREGSATPSEGGASVWRPSKRVKRKQATDARRAKFEQIRKVITEEDLEAEAELEAEISRLTQDPDCLANMADARMHDYEDRARSLAAVRREAERLGRSLKRPYSDKERRRDLAILNGEPVFGRSFSDDEGEEGGDGGDGDEGEEGRPRKRARSASGVDLDAEEIGCHEFDDDPQVANAIVGAEESAERETLWVDENKAWMRSQQRKQITSLVAEAEGRGKDQPQDQHQQHQQQQPKRRAKRARRGDGSLMAGLPAPRTTSESVERMLDKAHKGKKTWHKHINPEAIKAIYDEPDDDDDDDDDDVAASAPAPEPAASPAPSASAARDDDAASAAAEEGAAPASSRATTPASAAAAATPPARATATPPTPTEATKKKPAAAAPPTLSGINKSTKVVKPKAPPKRRGARAGRQGSMTPAQAGQARALAAMADAGGEVSMDGLAQLGDADGASAARTVLAGLGVDGIEGHVDDAVDALYAEDEE